VVPVLSPRHAALSPKAQPQAAASLQILIADDDDAVRNILQQLLIRQGHRVDAVASGEAALQQLSRSAYDLLCSDLGMPLMSGWELIHRARTRHPQLHTFLITGWGDQIDHDEARRRGVDRVLTKPFDSEQLRTVIATIIHRQADDTIQPHLPMSSSQANP
jgi:CheY-like chemotaxis protein